MEHTHKTLQAFSSDKLAEHRLIYDVDLPSTTPDVPDTDFDLTDRFKEVKDEVKERTESSQDEVKAELKLLKKVLKLKEKKEDQLKDGEVKEGKTAKIASLIEKAGKRGQRIRKYLEKYYPGFFKQLEKVEEEENEDEKEEDEKKKDKDEPDYKEDDMDEEDKKETKEEDEKKVEIPEEIEELAKSVTKAIKESKGDVKSEKVQEALKDLNKEYKDQDPAIKIEIMNIIQQNSFGVIAIQIDNSINLEISQVNESLLAGIDKPTLKGIAAFLLKLIELIQGEIKTGDGNVPTDTPLNPTDGNGKIDSLINSVQLNLSNAQKEMDELRNRLKDATSKGDNIVINQINQLIINQQNIINNLQNQIAVYNNQNAGLIDLNNTVFPGFNNKPLQWVVVGSGNDAALQVTCPGTNFRNINSATLEAIGCHQDKHISPDGKTMTITSVRARLLVRSRAARAKCCGAASHACEKPCYPSYASAPTVHNHYENYYDVNDSSRTSGNETVTVNAPSNDTVVNGVGNEVLGGGQQDISNASSDTDPETINVSADEDYEDVANTNVTANEDYEDVANTNVSADEETKVGDEILSGNKVNEPEKKA